MWPLKTFKMELKQFSQLPLHPPSQPSTGVPQLRFNKCNPTNVEIYFHISGNKYIYIYINNLAFYDYSYMHEAEGKIWNILFK